MDNDRTEAGNPSSGKDLSPWQEFIPKLAQAEILNFLSELGNFYSGKVTSLGHLEMINSSREGRFSSPFGRDCKLLHTPRERC